MLGVPGERAVVAVAGRDHATRAAHPSHLAQGLHRVGDVLEHLVRMHHVEGVVGQVEGVYVADHELRLDPAPAQLVAAQRQRVFGRLEGGHPSRGHEPGQVGGDGAGPGADVEQSLAGSQVRQQVRRGVLRRPPTVRAEDRLRVAVGVLRPVAVTTQ